MTVRFDPFCARCDFSDADGSACLRPVGEPGGLLVMLPKASTEQERQMQALHVRQLLKNVRWSGSVAVDWTVRCPVSGTATDAVKWARTCGYYDEATLRAVDPVHVVYMVPRAVWQTRFGSLPSDPCSTVRDGEGRCHTWLPALDRDNVRSPYVRAMFASVVANVKAGTYTSADPHRMRIVEVKTADDARACFEALREREAVFDAETYGRMHDDDFEVLMLAFADTSPEETTVWTWGKDSIREHGTVLRRLLSSTKLCGHNVSYDLSAVACGLGVDVPADSVGDDTMVLARLFDTERSSLSLANLAGLVGIVGHKDEAATLREQALHRLRAYVDAVKAGGSVGVQGGLFSRDVDDDKWRRAAERVAAGVGAETYLHGLIDQEVEMRYCALDVWATKYLLAWLRCGLAATGTKRSSSKLLDSHLRKAPWAIARMERAGLRFDMDAANELEAELRATVRELDAYLCKTLCVTNPGSTRQLAKALFSEPPAGLGLTPPYKTASGAAKVDEKTLDVLLRSKDVNDDVRRVLRSLLEYREASKIVSTYIEGPKTMVRDDGKIHPSFRLVGTKSGRMSCTAPNMQNVPSRGTYAKRVKNLFVAAPGYYLVQFDYANLELRIAAALSGDPELKRAFVEGLDLHSETARAVSPMLWGNDFETCGMGYTLDTAPDDDARDKLRAEQKRRRTICKVLNFGCVSMDTQVLTETGWKRYEDIRVGDKVLGRTGWVRVLEKVMYDKAPVVDWQGFRVTPNHRWWSWRRGYEGGKRVKKWGFTTLETATTEHNFVLSQKWDCGKGVGWGPDIAELVGWLLCDGHVSRKTVRLHQSNKANPLKVQHIDALLKRIGVPHVRDVRPTDIVEWRFLSPQSRVWRTRVNNLDELTVLRMSLEERQAFVRGGLMAEGYLHGSRWRFAQNPGRVAEVYRLAFFLEGYFVREWGNHGAGKYAEHRSLKLSLSKPHVTGQRLRYEHVGTEPVWCIRTEDETFVMRRGSSMALTGNTLYGQGPDTLAETMGLSREDAVKAQGAVLGNYRTLVRWIERQKQSAKRNHETWTWFESSLARRRWLPNIAKNSGDTRKAFNTPIQGTGHEYCLASLVRCSEWLVDNGIDAELVLQVHDSLVFHVAEDDVQEMCETVPKLMTEWTVLNDVPLEVDAEVGTRWGSLIPWRPDSATGTVAQ